MSTPTVVRVSPKRRIFASFTSKNVVRSPNLSLFSSSGTMTLVVLRVAPTQPTPLVATAEGALGIPDQQALVVRQGGCDFRTRQRLEDGAHEHIHPWHLVARRASKPGLPRHLRLAGGFELVSFTSPHCWGVEHSDARIAARVVRAGSAVDAKTPRPLPRDVRVDAVPVVFEFLVDGLRRRRTHRLIQPFGVETEDAVAAAVGQPRIARGDHRG